MKAGVAGLSGTLALVLLLPMEAGVPIPVPADLVMFAVGERVAAGQFPLWLAVTGFEVIAILGTTALFLACRGPAQRIITRFGPRRGRLGAERTPRAARAHRREQRVSPAPPGSRSAARAAGRPGLRTGQEPGPGRGGRAGRRRGGLLADQEAETGSGARGLDGGELPGVHRREPADRPRTRPGRADRAGPGPPGAR